MIQSNVTISVVVCSQSERRWNDLNAAIESLEKQRYRALEIIIVVDHNDVLGRRIEESRHRVRNVANIGVRGLSAARNTGIACAKGEVVAFLDDDAEADPDWLARMANHYADTAVMGVGGRVVPLWPSARPTWLPREFDWVVGCSYRGLPAVKAQVRNLIGCNMSFRRALFDQIGGFSDGIGRKGDDAAGAEETELCIRAVQANPQSLIIHDPAMIVRHRIARERTTWRYFRARCLAEGRSKSRMVDRVGAQSGLKSERRYVTRTLPSGIALGFRDALLTLDPGGLGRAAAIVCGLTYTATGYALARLAQRRTRRPIEAFAPIRTIDLDLEEPAQELGAGDSILADRFGGVFCLVRKDQRPIGTAEVRLNGEDMPIAKLADLLRRDFVGIDDVSPARPISPNPTPIAVIVATRDRSSSLAACLDSLLRQDYPSFEIVVVDSSPATNSTAELVSRRYIPTGRVRYLREDRPGLGRAHNRGVAQITAPIVAFTDDDVIADPRWLSTLAENLKNEQVGCVTGLILPAELDTRAQYWIEQHGGFGKGFVRKVFDLKENRPSGRLFPYTAGQFGSGANMAFRTDALRLVGGFDDALGAGTIARGGDDLAAFFAIIEAGYRLVYEPEAIIWHRHRRCEDGMRRQAFGYGVGLGAYLTKLAAERPVRLLHYAAAAPSGFQHLFASTSAKNRRLPADYPASLVWRERLGILVGVAAYFRSRAHARRTPVQPTAEGPAAAVPG